MQVDFRYTSDTCLMLMLDGHVEPQTRFQEATDRAEPYEDYDDLENDRNVRVANLTERWIKVRPPEP